MADKKTNEELRQEVLNEDATRDVNINLAVFVAAAAILSSAAAALAVISIVFLNTFRADVDDLWLCCVPLCFSFVTGLAVAYRKQMADVGVHIALAVTTLLAGGAGYGLSVEPVYFNRDNCTLPEDYHGECNKEVLTTIYFVAGAVASGCAVFGLLASLCACSNAMSRRAQREKYKQMRREYEENRIKGEVRDQKRRMGQPPPTATITNNTSSFNGTHSKMNGVNGLNGTPKAPLQIINEQPELTNEPTSEITTKPNPPEEVTVKITPEPEPPAAAPENQVQQQQQQPKTTNDLLAAEVVKAAETTTDVKKKKEDDDDDDDDDDDQPKVREGIREINTTTIIVRDFQHGRKKEASGVDRGTQVEPFDTIDGPAKQDVGVSPYQEEEKEGEGEGEKQAKPEGGSVEAAGTSVASSENRVQDPEGDKASKVMTHL